MAEDEIIKKHAESVIETWRSKEKTWLQKIRDIGQEVLIIVFAVSVSIWLHNWSEGKKDQKQAAAFEDGLKEDLKADIGEMQSDRTVLEQVRAHAAYYLNSGNNGSRLQPDSAVKYVWIFFSEAQINPRIGRYEALKSSGKLDIIEDGKLLYAITDLYQKTFPLIFRSNQSYNTLTTMQIGPYLGDIAKIDSTGKCLNIKEIAGSSKMHVMLMQMIGYCNNSIKNYTEGIDKSTEILKMLK